MGYRFADHDMLMHYHWGLATGHMYTYDKTTDIEHTADWRVMRSMAMEEATNSRTRDGSQVHTRDIELTRGATGRMRETSLDPPGSDSDINQPELEFGNREDDKWEDVPLSDSDLESGWEDNDMFAAMEEMYGSHHHYGH